MTINKKSNYLKYFFMTVVLVSLTACQGAMPSYPTTGKNRTHPHMGMQQSEHIDESTNPPAIDLKTITHLDTVVSKLSSKQVIFIGESHDRYDHHMNQLEIIRRLYEDNHEVVIAMEFFQQPFQKYLDAYIAGSIDERDFLRKTEYFHRWRIDYRNYRPIIQYAKEHSIPLLALDTADELKHKVAQSGIEGLDPEDRKQVPEEIDRSNVQYRKMLKSIYAMHPQTPGQNFEKFEDGQLLRDESMAQRAAQYLKEHSKSRMVVLAGGGHLVYGYGIPSRLKRRINIASAIVLNNIQMEPEVGLADYMLLSTPVQLPQQGRLGAYLNNLNEGGVSITNFTENSPAKLAGIERNDRIISLDGKQTGYISDVKYALLEKQPGDTVKVKVQRKNWLGTVQEREFEVVLY